MVGSHGANRRTVALGSVAADVAEGCTGSVAVIHPSPDPRERARRGWRRRFGGQSGGDRVRVRRCGRAEGAVDRRALLDRPEHRRPGSHHSAGVVSIPQIQDEERTLLDRELADWVERYPDVRVQQAVIHDRPAVGLLEYAPFAQLIVAGSRGQGGIAGMLLGSTGQALIAHGTCPVVIVRPALVAAIS